MQLVPRYQADPRIPRPRAPTYPAFAKTNAAYRFADAQSALTIREADLPKANLRFQNGDSITLEACVNIKELKDGNR